MNRPKYPEPENRIIPRCQRNGVRRSALNVRRSAAPFVAMVSAKETSSTWTIGTLPKSGRSFAFNREVSVPVSVSGGDFPYGCFGPGIVQADQKDRMSPSSAFGRQFPGVVAHPIFSWFQTAGYE
jgi:hypothetical protein